MISSPLTFDDLAQPNRLSSPCNAPLKKTSGVEFVSSCLFAMRTWQLQTKVSQCHQTQSRIINIEKKSEWLWTQTPSQTLIVQWLQIHSQSLPSINQGLARFTFAGSPWTILRIDLWKNLLARISELLTTCHNSSLGLSVHVCKGQGPCCKSLKAYIYIYRKTMEWRAVHTSRSYQNEVMPLMPTKVQWTPGHSTTPPNWDISCASRWRTYAYLLGLIVAYDLKSHALRSRTWISGTSALPKLWNIVEWW